MRFWGLKILAVIVICGFLQPNCFAAFEKSQPLPYYYDNPDAIKKSNKKPKEIKTNMYGNKIRPQDTEYIEPGPELFEVNNEIEIEKEKSVTDKIKEHPYAQYFKRKHTMDNVDQNAPKTLEEYYEMAKDVKREDIEIPEPDFNRDDRLVAPDPHLRIVPYNDPPGSYELNLTELTRLKRINSIGVLSPDQSRLVYSAAYYYRTNKQVASEVYEVKVNPNLSMQDKMKFAHDLNKEPKPLLTTGTDYLQGIALKTMTVIDWSIDGKKIAVKEKIGSSLEGVWQTNLFVYDFETKKSKKLNEIREAIRYYWKQNKNIDLIDFMWDIHPIGWDQLNPDRIIVYAYAYTDAAPKFLGTWSIDSKGERSQLLSLTDTGFAVSVNGFCLRGILRE